MVGRGAVGSGAGLAAWGANCFLVAQADAPAPPTTIVVAFISIALSLGGLVVWVVKKKFEEADKDREANAANLKAEREANTANREADRKHDADEREKDRRHATITIEALRMELSRYHESREKDREQLAITLTELRKRRHERDAREEGAHH